MMWLSVSKLATLTKCRACFIEELTGLRKAVDGRVYAGLVMHRAYKMLLKREADILSDDCRRLTSKSIKKAYGKLALEITHRLLDEYSRKLSIDEAVKIEVLLKKFSLNVLEKRSAWLINKVKELNYTNLESILGKRIYEPFLSSPEYKVYGSPDMIEGNIIFEFKYSKPPKEGFVRKDFLLQVTWYSILSGIKTVEIVYLPSLVTERFKISREYVSWAEKILNEARILANSRYNILEHTCRHTPQPLVKVGGGLNEESIHSILIYSAYTI